jgi:hypothetical protein
MTQSSLHGTLKASLANFSPGFVLKPWVENAWLYSRNSEGVARFAVANSDATPSELRYQTESMFPGLPERNPELELANAFSVEDRGFSPTR